MSGGGPTLCSLWCMHVRGIDEPFVTSQGVDLQKCVFYHTLSKRQSFFIDMESALNNQQYIVTRSPFTDNQRVAALNTA